MHPEARHFVEWTRATFPQYFRHVKVLDAGGGDINGNNRSYFAESVYLANDVVEAPNVDIVAKTSDLTFRNEYFDTIISTECFEHDMDYPKSLQNIVRMLRPNGLFVFTCATTGRPEHGTKRTTPQDSYSTQLYEWGDYYKNLTPEDIHQAIPVRSIFSEYAFYCNETSHDMYFYGIKRTEHYAFSDATSNDVLLTHYSPYH